MKQKNNQEICGNCGLRKELHNAHWECPTQEIKTFTPKKDNHSQIASSAGDGRVSQLNRKAVSEAGSPSDTSEKSQGSLKLICGLNQELVKKCIKNCEGRHIQQVAYSSYHDALTQICFTCRKIRTSMKEEDLKKEQEDDRT